MQKIVFAITHSNTWFWTETCIAALKWNMKDVADHYETEIVVVDNSWDNSPSIYGITKTRLGDGVKVINNTQASFCHSAALDLAFHATWPMDFFVPIDSDCVITKPTWFGELRGRMRPTDYAVGDWHHEEWVYPSFALYRGEVIKAMADASEANKDDQMRWGENFSLAAPIPEGHGKLLSGPFSDRRGWPQGTVLKQRPTGQCKGPGHYEPGQQFHHWALEQGHTYSVCPALTIRDHNKGIPVGTFYGIDPALPVGYDEARDACWAVHFWAGTRALDYINPRAGHPLRDDAILRNMPFWVEREGGWWLHEVPEDVRAVTLKLIKQYGWMKRPIPDSPPDALDRIYSWYRASGINFE